MIGLLLAGVCDAADALWLVECDATLYIAG
jgi:hypothetical protein